MKKASMFLVLAILAAGMVSAATIHFAWVGPLTGDAKQYGDTEKVAVAIALETLKARGGVLGNDVSVDFYDDKNDATEAVTIANKIVGMKKYTAVIGHFSSTPAMAAAPIYDDSRLIMYSPTASHAKFSSLGEYVFRNTPTQAIETAAYADYVYNTLGLRSVAILNVNDDWGNNIAAIFRDNFQKLGGRITITEVFIPGQTKDFTPMISKIKQTRPEGFFPVAYYAESAQILIQSESLEFKPKQMILSSSTLKQELLDLAGKLAEGVFLMNAYTPDIKGAEFQRVIRRYTELTGKQGDAFVMQTYDVVMQLAEAIRQTGSLNVPAIRKTLAGMKDYEALAGKYSMNELGDAVRPLQPIKVIGGKFVNIAKGN